VVANTATHFAVSAPANIPGGTAFNVTVTALDAFENVATGYTRTIHFTTTAASAVLPADYTFVAGDNGVKMFSVTLNTFGSQTVTVKDTLNNLIAGTSNMIFVGS